MKKARIMLIVLGISILLGGTLASKVKRTVVIYTATTSTTTGTAVLASAVWSANALGKVYWTTSPTGLCINFSYTTPHQ